MKIIVDSTQARIKGQAEPIIDLDGFPAGFARNTMGQIVRSLRRAGYEVIEGSELKVRLCSRCKLRPVKSSRSKLCALCAPIVEHEKRREHDHFCA